MKLGLFLNCKILGFSPDHQVWRKDAHDLIEWEIPWFNGYQNTCRLLDVLMFSSGRGFKNSSALSA